MIEAEMTNTPKDLRVLAQKLEGAGFTGAVLCVVAAAEIEHCLEREGIYKQEMLAADSLVRIGDHAVVVPSRVKVEVERLRLALGNLRITAALLFQNAEGCAANHYGEDAQQGVPGWLIDCQKDIDAAVAAFQQ